MTEAQVKNAVEKFEALIRAQSDRSDKIKAQGDFIDFKSLDKIIIGVCGGDGIGPVITKESARVLEYLLDDKVKAGKIEFKVIDGLTIENRVKANKAIPDDVLEELKSCHVILKGPTTTPQAGDPWPNIESANVAMRKALDLFANLRPVKVPELLSVRSVSRTRALTGLSSARTPRAHMPSARWASMLPTTSRSTSS